MLMSEGCYMESIDLKNAYYSICLDEKVTQFLNFNGMDYKFQVLVIMVMCLSSSRLFTLVIKPVLTYL